ncbi:MAG TPA: adenylate/guanylate cyclase domain-containing protein [Aggregatilineales bacterium]|nr:adenylate/guanylate cyclase domain-containing protein [Aggregatilineales bacterium]
MSTPYFLVHPILNLLTVAFILVAFGTKSTRHKYHYWHYIPGLAALVSAVVAVFIGTLSVQRTISESNGDFIAPLTLHLHIIIGILAILFLVTQAVMGVLMWRHAQVVGRLLKYHRRFGQLMMGILLLLSIFGGLTRYYAATSDLEQLSIMATMVLVLSVTTLLVFNYRRGILQRRHRSPVRRMVSKPELASDSGVAHNLNVYYVPDEKQVETNPSKTILRTSLDAGIPHTHVCGGNARCSTCRIAILDGLENCLPRNSNERALAERLSFPSTVRLACQTKVTGNVKIRRLVLDTHDIQITSQISPDALPGSIGEEKHMGILFADIRGFTSFAEALPPYDVIHALNRYYQDMDISIQTFGGTIDNYMGDGLLAHFDGVDPNEVALRSVKAGLGMLDKLQTLRPYFQTTYARPLEIGIGLHYGQVVLGSLGAPRHKRVTVIGDAVNFASRIESANKEAGTRFLISDDTYQIVKDTIKIGRKIQVSVKGKTGEHTLYEVTGLANSMMPTSSSVLERGRA